MTSAAKETSEDEGWHLKYVAYLKHGDQRLSKSVIIRPRLLFVREVEAASKQLHAEKSEDDDEEEEQDEQAHDGFHRCQQASHEIAQA